MSHWKTAENKSQKKRHKRKGVMTKKQLKEFFGHKFECKEQKLTLFGQKISTESEEVYDIYCDKNGQICEVIPIDKTSKSFLNFYRGVPLKLLTNE